MGRAQQPDSDDDRISPEPELPLVHKKKGIQKAKLRKMTPTARLGPQKAKAPKVGLNREELSLEAKQSIFEKVVGELSGKKVRRKNKKKQRYLIKKVLGC